MNKPLPESAVSQEVVFTLFIECFISFTVKKYVFGELWEINRTQYLSTYVSSGRWHSEFLNPWYPVVQSFRNDCLLHDTI